METTVYLRREPDSEGNNVVAYRDEACTDRIGHWMWWQVHKPTARTTHVTLSGKRHKVAWAERLTADKA